MALSDDFDLLNKLPAIVAAVPVLHPLALQVCDDAIAAGKALTESGKCVTNLGTSTKNLLVAATPYVEQLK